MAATRIISPTLAAAMAVGSLGLGAQTRDQAALDARVNRPEIGYRARTPSRCTATCSKCRVTTEHPQNG